MVQIIDSYYYNQLSLVGCFNIYFYMMHSFSNIETQEQFYTVFDQFTFSNMNFTSGGYLINFGQQTLTQTILSNMVLTNIFSGAIHLEAHNPNLPFKTNVLIQNGKFENVNVDTNSIFLLNEGANLEIRNSSFNQISWLESGCLIYGSYQNTITTIYDSSFTNITAVKAALFLIEDASVMKIYRWNMVQNFAITSALIYATNDGYFEIYDSKIFQNYAVQNVISEIFSSSYYSIIDNTTIYNNEAVSQESIYAEFTGSWRLLWFVPSTLREYIISKPAIYDYPTAPKLFELIYAKLIIQNKSVVYNQVSIAKCFISTLTFYDSSFYNLAIQEKGMRMSQAIVNITDCTFYNISTSDYSAFIFAGVNSEIYIVNTTYSNWTWPFLSSAIAKISFERLTISSWYTYMECISILTAPNIFILNSKIIYAISNNSTSPFRMVSSTVDLISNLTISNLDQYAIYMNSWNATMIDGLHISNTYGIYVKSSNINKIANSKFENNGKGYSSLSQVSIKGGSMLFINSNFTIDSSLFYKNTANYGAGIYITCQFNPMCVTSISNTTFSNNYAQNSGGGFIYDLYRPTLSNIVFINNSALYGPNIASYPIKIKIGDTSINTVTVNDAVSGQVTQAFTFNILDFDDQVITLDSVSKITVRPSTAGAQIDGKSIGVANAGVVYMDRVVLISMPGSTNVVFSVTPSTINVDIAKAVYGDNYKLPSIIANFRYCQLIFKKKLFVIKKFNFRPGEYSNSHKWLPWSEGSFSLLWNATQCEKWLSNANCEGDEVVFVNSGYWRKTTNSTIIVEWPNKNACEGGYNTTSTYPVNWAAGYKGVLCSKWTKL